MALSAAPERLKPYTAILRDKRKMAPTLSPAAEYVAAFQGCYYIVRGILLLHQRVDIALGGLLVTAGAVFVMAVLRSVLTHELGILLIGFALTLGILDVLGAGHTLMPIVFFAEGAKELLVAALAIALLPGFTHRRHSTFV